MKYAKYTSGMETYLRHLYERNLPFTAITNNFNELYGLSLSENAVKVKLQRLNGTRK